MRTLLIIGLGIALVFALGWVTFSSTRDEAQLQINTGQIREDTREIMQRGREVVGEATETINEEVDEIESNARD